MHYNLATTTCRVPGIICISYFKSLGSLPQNIFSFLNKQKPSLSNINGDDLAPDQGEKTFKVIKNNQQTTPHTSPPQEPMLISQK